MPLSTRSSSPARPGVSRGFLSTPVFVSICRCACAAVLAGGMLFAGVHAKAQTFREHTRAERGAAGAVDETQAVDLTLTLVQVAQQSIQTWVRTAASLDDSRRILTGCVAQPAGGLVQASQRVRAFPPDSKSSIYQARVSSAVPHDGCVLVEARLSGPVYGDFARFVMEIIIDLGRHLAVPNEAIIEREDSQIVYVQRQPGKFEPAVIETGRRGELYSEVVAGLAEGDQVVTFGSFFIDADYRLKADPTSAAGDAHLHH